jgi:hypothetical protein
MAGDFGITAAVLTVVSVALSVAAALLAPKPKGMVEQNPEIQIPGASEGEPVPVVFGTCDVKGTVIWPLSPGKMEKQKVKVSSGGGKGGFDSGEGLEREQWKLSFAVALGWGQMDRLEEIRIDDCAIWVGPITYDPTDYPEGKATLTTEREGTVRFRFGTSDQVADNRIDIRETYAPNWPNISYCVFRLFDVGDLPTVPNLTFRARRSPVSPLTDTNLLIDTGGGCYLEANPVHVMAEILTNTVWGAGMPAELLDDTSWSAAAATVATEKRGVSFVLNRLETVEQVLAKLLYHIDGGLVKRGNVWHLKLIRQDYVVNDTELVAESDVVSWSDQPGTASATVNFVTAEFSNQEKFYNTGTIPMSNAAAVLSVDNTKREVIRLPYFTNRDVARSVAQTKMQLMTVPHDAATLEVRRRGGLTVEWGDVVRVDYSPAGVASSRLWRVIEVTRSARGPQYATLKLVEELGSMSHTAPDVDGDDDTPIEPDGIEGPLECQMLMELPWDESRSDSNMRAVLLAGRRAQDYTDLRVWGGMTIDAADVLKDPGSFAAATGDLDAEYSDDTLEVDDAGFLVVDPAVGDLEEFAVDGSVTRAELYGRRVLVVIGGEIMAAQVCEVEVVGPPAKYRLRGIVRGLWDTRPATHAAGSCVFILRVQWPYYIPKGSDWVNNGTLYAKPQPYTTGAVGDLADFNQSTVTLQERAKRPYPVSSLLADGVGDLHGPKYTAGGTVRLSWIPRTRGAGCGFAGNPDGIFDADIAVEGPFKVSICGADGTTLLATYYVDAGTTFVDGFGVARHYYDYTPATHSNPAQFTAKVWARASVGTPSQLVLGGGYWDSLTAQEITVTKL